MSSYTSVPAVAGPTNLHTVCGVWTKKSPDTVNSLDAVDAVAHVETPPDFSLPAHPPATYSAYHEPWSFDSAFAAGTPEPDRPLSCAALSAPPPYAPHGYEVMEKQIKAHSVEEPPTLARTLFIYGFLFFPFWLAGIYILCSPLRPTPDWETGKTEAEKLQLLCLLQEAEKKWARRCLYALFSLAVTVFLLVLIIKYSIMAGI